MTDDIATDEPPAVADVAPQDDGPSDGAPYGWMTDPGTGERRPKKRPGRRSRKSEPPAGRTPSLDELQALGSLAEASEDAAPGVPAKGGRRKPAAKTDLPPFRAGVIAKGVNRLYRKAGRFLRLLDYDIGTAVIAITRVPPRDDDDDDGADDLTVGEAWEAVAKSNPRIRAFLLKAITGGAWSSLLMAHAPIFLAIAMKDGIRERLPFAHLAEAFLMDEPDQADGEPVPSGLAGLLGGIGPEDMAQMMQMAQAAMGQAASAMPRSPNPPRDPAADQG